MTPYPICLAVLLACLTAPAAAETRIGAKNQPGLFANQLRILDGRAAEQYAGSSRLRPDTDEVIPRYQGGYQGPYLSAARAAARRHGVPEDLFLRLIEQESAWNAGAISVKGAIGLAQLMPGTAQALGVDARDPEENLEGGARYLARQYQKFRSWPLALAAYNAGPGAVERHKGIPPFRETETYVARIWGPVR